MAIILGIDPGSRITGYGVIKKNGNNYKYISSGCIKTTINKDVASRLFEIHQGISALITEFCPQEAAIEKVFMHENPDSALKLGQARGAAFVAVAGYDIPIAEYTPRTVKQAVVGYGGADKQQVQYMIKFLLGLSDVPQPDAADALAIAICHAGHPKPINWKK